MERTRKISHVDWFSEDTNFKRPPKMKGNLFPFVGKVPDILG